jgi:pimeloyl-ACP methyl ester carboxylesterase
MLAFDHLTDVVEAFLGTVGITRFAVHVHDYGAPIGWRLALRDPDRTRGTWITRWSAARQGGPAVGAVRRLPQQRFAVSPRPGVLPDLTRAVARGLGRQRPDLRPGRRARSHGTCRMPGSTCSTGSLHLESHLDEATGLIQDFLAGTLAALR